MSKSQVSIILLFLGMVTGALLGISINLGKLVNKKIEPEIITQTIHYYDGKALKHCPLTDEVPCSDLKGNIILDENWAK